MNIHLCVINVSLLLCHAVMKGGGDRVFTELLQRSRTLCLCCPFNCELVSKNTFLKRNKSHALEILHPVTTFPSKPIRVSHNHYVHFDTFLIHQVKCQLGSSHVELNTLIQRIIGQNSLVDCLKLSLSEQIITLRYTFYHALCY